MPKNRKDPIKRRTNAAFSAPGVISSGGNSPSTTNSALSSPLSVPDHLLPTPSSSLGSRTTEDRLIDFEEFLDSPSQDVSIPEAHTREPILPSRQSTLSPSHSTLRSLATSTSELLARSNLTMRPISATIAVKSPTGAPSPPTLNPVEGFGSFTTSNPRTLDDVKESQHQDDNIIPTTSSSPASFPPPPSPLGPPTLKSKSSSGGSGVVGLGLPSFSPPRRSVMSTLPSTREESGVEGSDLHVKRSKFDTLLGRKILIVLYSTRPIIQIWDLSSLAAVSEILNIDASVHCLSLSLPIRDAGVLGGEFIGILSAKGMMVYSMTTHQVVSKVQLGDREGEGVTFECDERKESLVLATVNPPTLRIYHSTTLELVHVIQESDLATFSYFKHTVQALGIQHAHPSPSFRQQSYPDSTTPFQSEGWDHHSSFPEPVFALNGRMLAYASSSPISSSPLVDTSGVRKAGGKFGLMLGNAVKSLAGSLASTPPSSSDGIVGGESRSAPSSSSSPSIPWRKREERGGWIILLDLCGGGKGKVEEKGKWFVKSSWNDRIVGRGEDVLSGFRTSTAPSNVEEGGGGGGLGEISTLHFTADGLVLWVGLSDGRIVRGYSIPSLSLSSTLNPPSPTHNMSSSLVQPRRPLGTKEPGAVAPEEVYTINRGFTPSLLSGIAGSDDGRWCLVFSRKNGTGHFVAVNPYGGKPDVRSHVSGRVVDPGTMGGVDGTTTLSPLARIRPTHGPRSITFTSGNARIPPPTIYTFLPSPGSSAYEKIVPSSLVPVVEDIGSEGYVVGSSGGSWSSPKSLSSAGTSTSPNKARKSASPRVPTYKPLNYQDVLLFDPVDGVLELRRVSVDATFAPSASPVPSGITTSTRPVQMDKLRDYVPSMGGVRESIMGFIAPTTSTSSGEVSVSPSAAMMGALGDGSPSSWTSVGLTGMASDSPPKLGIEGWGDGEMMMSGKDLGFVAKWDRLIGGGEVKKIIRKEKGKRLVGGCGKDYLSQAEISTFSSRHLKSIYLSHQFSFSTLSGEEDYHALIRSYRFDSLVSNKVEVRKGVVLTTESSIPSGSSGSPGDAIREHLLDAHDLIGMGTDEVLPMYPNGYGRGPGVISIPIGRIVKGAAAGVQREVVGKGIGVKGRRRVSDAAAAYSKLLSPAARADDDPAQGVPLEDEELVSYEDGLEMDDDGEIWENGWGKEDGEAVSEMERFEEFLDGPNIRRGRGASVEGEDVKAQVRGKIGRKPRDRRA